MITETTRQTNRSVLRLPGFTRYLFAYALSGIGDQFRLLTLTLWVFVGSDESAFARVLLLLIGIAPPLVLGMFSGVVADRGRQRTVMIASDLLRALCSVALAVSCLTDSLPLTYVAVAASSIVSVFFTSSSFTVVPRLVPRESLGRANGILETVGWAVSASAPALAGLAFVGVGPEFAFGLDALTFVASALLLSGLPLGDEKRTAAPAGAPRRRRRWGPAVRDALRENAEGLRYIRDHAVAKWFIVTSLGPTITANANSVALIFLLTQDLDTSVQSLGFVISVGGVIAVISGLLVTAFAHRIDHGQLLVFSLAGLVVSQFGMGAAPTVFVLSCGVVISGFANAPFNTAYDTVLQQSVDQKFLGRVEGVATTLDTAVRIAVMCAAGLLVSAVGARPVFLLAGAVASLSVAVGLMFLLPARRRLASANEPGDADKPVEPAEVSARPAV